MFERVLGIFELVLAFANVGSPNPELTLTQVSLNNTGGGSTSAPFYPSPWSTPGTVGWEDAYVKAKEFVSQLTLLEKVNLTTGVGYVFEDEHSELYDP
jgi:hypothetical protein